MINRAASIAQSSSAPLALSPPQSPSSNAHDTGLQAVAAESKDKEREKERFLSGERARTESELTLALARCKGFEEIAQVYRSALCSQLESASLWYKLALALFR